MTDSLQLSFAVPSNPSVVSKGERVVYFSRSLPRRSFRADSTSPPFLLVVQSPSTRWKGGPIRLRFRYLCESRRRFAPISLSFRIRAPLQLTSSLLPFPQPNELNERWITPSSDQNLSTSCFPRGINSHRRQNDIESRTSRDQSGRARRVDDFRKKISRATTREEVRRRVSKEVFRSYAELSLTPAFLLRQGR